MRHSYVHINKASYVPQYLLRDLLILTSFKARKLGMGDLFLFLMIASWFVLLCQIKIEDIEVRTSSCL